jgi:hypothetical protein
MKNINITVLSMVLTATLFLGCGEDRADMDAAQKLRQNGVLGVVESDRDGDGLSDEDEVNIYHTNPDNNDSDGDSLLDGAEVNHVTEPTNPNNPDTDGDGLRDNLEVNGYPAFNIGKDDLNATNPDTDGDCLLDSFEVRNYATHPNNIDTDSDGVEDGLEVYGNLNASCIQTPQTLVGGVFLPAAMDNIPTPDVIDALDPTNDSDGDGQANIKELSCPEGDPKDKNKICPFVTETAMGNAALGLGYTYIPGGFDVDGDGNKEGGFWASIYQATETNVTFSNDMVKSQIGDNFNNFLGNNFTLINRIDENISGFIESEFPRNDEAKYVTFVKSDILDDVNATTPKRLTPRYVGRTPYMAKLLLKQAKISYIDKGNNYNIDIGMLTNKQYSHVQKLLDADKAKGGDGTVVRNGLLGLDINVPVLNYEIHMKEFDENHTEFVSDALLVYSSDGVEFNEATDIQDWWEITKKEYPTFGTNSRWDLRDLDNNGVIDGTTSDEGGYYSVMVRGGHLLHLKQGIVGGRGEINPITNIAKGIGFRAATNYLY